MRSRVAALLAAVLVAGACSCGSPDDAGDPSGSLLQDGEPADFDVNGHSLQVVCTGSGEPTVVLVSGLGGDRHGWDPLVPELASHSRVCSYDRAGLGGSEASDDPTPTAAEMADELADLLEAAGITPPLVLVGHSYGGMIARVFADTRADDVSGLLLVDSAVEDEFTEGLFAEIDWSEGGTAIDTSVTAEQLRDADDLGDVPLVVLTQGEMSGRFSRLWTRWQRDLAAISANSVHVSATTSGHFIQEDQPALVLQGVADLVAAAGGELPACDDRYADIDGECL